VVKESTCKAQRALLADVIDSPVTLLPAPGPWRTTTGAPVYPGAVRPSMTVPPLESLSAGRGLATVTVPATLKVMTSVGSEASLTWAFASRIAWRREPGPLSARVFTVKTAGAMRSSRTLSHGKVRNRVDLSGRRRAGRRGYQEVSQVLR